MFDEPKCYPRRDFLAQVAAVPALAAVASQWQPNQSLAQTATAVADPLVIAPLPEAELVRQVEALMQFVDPAIAYRHTPIAPERNAWPYFERAIAAYVEEPEHFDADETISEFIDGGPSPKGQLLQEFRDWVIANEPARRLTNEGTAKGAFERPRATKSIALDIDTDEAMGLRDLARLKCALCQLLLLDGRVDEALLEARGISNMAEILQSSESLIVDFLIAGAIQSEATSAAYSVGRHSGANREHAEAAIALLNMRRDRDFFRQSHCVELCRWFLPKLARMPQTSDPVGLATALLTPHWVSSHQPSEKELAEVRRAIDHTARVLQGHPHPFDREATVRLANELQLQWFAELEKPCWERSKDCLGSLRHEMSVWPKFARTDLMPTILDDDARFEPRPTEEDFQRYRQALHGIDNVVGKWMAFDYYRIQSDFLIEVYEVRLRSLQLRIALSHFERQHGELPATLESLVGDGWFAAVPTDPYDGQPFRYSREQRLIWSVGRDGDNDPFGKDRLESDDAFEGNLKGIWRIPPVPAA